MDATQSPVYSGGNRAGFNPTSLVALRGAEPATVNSCGSAGLNTLCPAELNSDTNIKVPKSAPPCKTFVPFKRASNLTSIKEKGKNICSVVRQ
jgi:hypothetical protein